MKGNVCTGLYYHDEKTKMIYELRWSQCSIVTFSLRYLCCLIAGTWRVVSWISYNFFYLPLFCTTEYLENDIRWRLLMPFWLTLNYIDFHFIFVYCNRIVLLWQRFLTCCDMRGWLSRLAQDNREKFGRYIVPTVERRSSTGTRGGPTVVAPNAVNRACADTAAVLPGIACLHRR